MSISVVSDRNCNWSKSKFSKQRNYNNARYDLEKDLIVINKRKNTGWKNFHICDKVNHNGFCNILNIQINRNHVIVFTCTRQYIIRLHMFYVCVPVEDSRLSLVVSCAFFFHNYIVFLYVLFYYLIGTSRRLPPKLSIVTIDKRNLFLMILIF